MQLSTIDSALDALRAGKPVLVADSADRENEGDAIIAAELVTPEWMALDGAQHNRLPLRADGRVSSQRPRLPLMTTNNKDPHGTNYTITVDASNRKGHRR
jgi:3,4-dihydroxy 2-butanone 4-phosphate synthase / GTP cyclohydrolase II